MKRILWRLATASGVVVALALGAGPAAAASGAVNERPLPTMVQVTDQRARTQQHADSSATSEQFLPVNANVPVQILSLGSNGGDTKQSNSSTAKSTATNEAWTGQSVEQHQATGAQHEPQGHDQKGHDQKRSCPKAHEPDGHDQYGHGPTGYEPQGRGPGYRPERPAFQVARQDASTDQDATSSATSKQIAPLNLNVPVQILSLGSNGGDTKQSNNSTAESTATNQAGTDQSAEQHQGSSWSPEPNGYEQSRHDGWDNQPHRSDGSTFQGAGQAASTDQDATSSATSKQIAPVNVNAPVQILSLGSNGGDTQQSNNSTARSSATNVAGTDQVIGQAQGTLGGLIG